MNFEQVIRQNKLFVFCFIFSGAILAMSFFAEFIWNIKPCTLCKWQRFALFAVFLIALMGLWTQKKQLALQLLLLVFVALSLIAGYHILILNGLVSDPCAVPQVKTVSDFKALLDTQSSCSITAWYMFGLPASTYNFLFGATLAFACSRKVKKTRLLYKFS